jgi:lambda family phage tail tape measure protein
MALQRFTRRAAEAAQGTGEAKDALAQMGIALRDQSGNLGRSEDLLADVADAFARIEDPAERVRLAFKLFDSEGVALVNLLRGGSDALDEMRERARDLGIVLDEHLVRDAERARTELDTLAQVISANLTRAALEAVPVIADLSSWLADVAGKAGIAWERLFDAPEEKSLRTLRYELDLTESTIAKLEARIQELRESPTLGFTTFIDTAQINAVQKKIDELSRARGQTQARIAFLEGPPEQPGTSAALSPAPDDTAGVKDRAERLERIQQELESTLFGITHEGSERITAEHERRIAEIEALRAKDGSNAQQVDQLIAQSAAVRDAQLSQLRAKEVEAAEKVRAANERVVASLEAEREALAQTERERFVAQALSRLSAEATAEQRREVEQLAGALFDEQQALQVRQRLMDEGRSVIDRTRTATEQHAAETLKLNELLAAGAIDQATYARAVEDANDRALRSSQAWTDGATRFLKDYVAESNDAAAATERAFATAFGGAEDSLLGFIASGKLEFRSLADSILADLARTTVRQTITAPLAGALQSAFAGGGPFGLFHEGGIAGGRPPAARFADAAVFEHAPRYHGGGSAGSGLLPDEVPVIARRGELVVPPERVVREEKPQLLQRLHADTDFVGGLADRIRRRDRAIDQCSETTDRRGADDRAAERANAGAQQLRLAAQPLQPTRRALARALDALQTLLAALADRDQLGLDLPAALDRQADGIGLGACGHFSVHVSRSRTRKGGWVDGLEARLPRPTSDSSPTSSRVRTDGENWPAPDIHSRGTPVLAR